MSELYDPATGLWTTNAARTSYLAGHTATLLPNGKVLVVFGYRKTMGQTVDGTALYDSASGTWKSTQGPNIGRYFYTATLLPNGKVLIAGGDSDSFGELDSAEIYDPSSGIWTTISSMTAVREGHTATLLPNGRVLIAGGGGLAPTNSAELYDIGLGISPSWQPQMVFPSSLTIGTNLSCIGFHLRGISEAAGGNSQNAASDHPIVQIRSVESQQTIFLPATNWSATSFKSDALFNFPPGYALATVFVNGIPGSSAILNITSSVPTAPVILAAKKLVNGSFQFAFTNSPGDVFGALATTNPALPLSNWTALSGVTEVSPGQFQFSDSPSTNSKRFYRVRSL